jgi:hypothetical protein
MSATVLEGGERGRPPACPPELALRMIQMRRAGMTYEAISDVLNAEGVPMPCGGSRWLKSSIDRILHSRYATRLAASLPTLAPTPDPPSTGLGTLKNNANP